MHWLKQHWAVLGCLGPVLGCLGPVLGCLGPVLGLFWARLGPVWGCLGTVLGCLGPVLGCLGPVLRCLGLSWDCLGFCCSLKKLKIAKTLKKRWFFNVFGSKIGPVLGCLGEPECLGQSNNAPAQGLGGVRGGLLSLIYSVYLAYLVA